MLVYWGRNRLVSVVVVRSVGAGKNQFGDIKHWAPVWGPWNPSGDTCMAFSRSLEFPKFHAMFGVHLSERIYVLINKYTEVKPLLPVFSSACFTGWREVCESHSFPYLSLSSSAEHTSVHPSPSFSPFILYPTASLICACFKKRMIWVLARLTDTQTSGVFLKLSLPSSQGNWLPGSVGAEPLRLVWLHVLAHGHSDTFQRNDGFLTSLSLLPPTPPHQKRNYV